MANINQGLKDISAVAEQFISENIDPNEVEYERSELNVFLREIQQNQ
jgi:hypothetical protein